MWVTTRHKPNERLLQQVKEWCAQLNLTYVQRGNDSIATLMKRHALEELLVLADDFPRIYFRGALKPYFFHPGLSVLRIKNILKGDNDVMVEVAELKEGDSFLDCTLGMASDAITASYIVGEIGKVVGVESSALIAALTKDGLSRWQQADLPELEEVLQRIEVVTADHVDYLRTLETNSFDVVYFDPMFRLPVHESVGISSLRELANTAPIREDAVREALRVCKRKVMIKERVDSEEFARLGFKKIERSKSSITFGVIEKAKDE